LAPSSWNPYGEKGENPLKTSENLPLPLLKERPLRGFIKGSPFKRENSVTPKPELKSLKYPNRSLNSEENYKDTHLPGEFSHLNFPS